MYSYFQMNILYRSLFMQSFGYKINIRDGTYYRYVHIGFLRYTILAEPKHWQGRELVNANQYLVLVYVRPF